MFKRIVALALNPSLDTTLWIEKFIQSQENMVQEECTDASGKAVNLARTFKYYNIKSSLILLLGEHNKHEFLKQLDRESIEYKAIFIDGNTRENLSVVQEDKSVTRLIRKGFAVPYEQVEETVEELKRCVDKETLVMISGALPAGISSKILRNICDEVHSLGGQVALDSRSVSCEDILAIKPWIIKPNKDEFEQLAGRKFEGLDDIVAFATTFVEGGVKNCLVSLGAEGMLCVSAEGAFWATAPSVEVRSTVGAGDNALAGFVKSKLGGMSDGVALKTAVAFGSAACMEDGSRPPHKLSVCNLLGQVSVNKL